MARLHRGPRVDVLAAGTDFQIKRHGEDARFAGGALRVPANLLRDRAADVLDTADLARRHRAYRYRVMSDRMARAPRLRAARATTAPRVTQAER